MNSGIPVLGLQQAAAAVLSGLFLLFFGFFAYRATIVIYLALVGALVGHVVGVRMFETSYPLLWGMGGALAGAIVAVPVEVFLRVLLGVVTGAGLGLAVGMSTGSWEGAVLGLALGAVVGGILWMWLGEVFVMVMFASLGAADAMVGVLSFLQHGQQTLVLPPASIVGLLFCALLGAGFQYLLYKPPKGPVPEREGEHFNERTEYD